MVTKTMKTIGRDELGRFVKGYKETKERKIKRALAISKGKMGKKYSEEFKRNLSKIKKKQRKDPSSIYNSKEYKEKISELGKLRKGIYPFSKRYIGKENHAWKGGISFEPYGLEFNEKLKEKIRKRDNFICQECDCPQIKLKYKLHIHHIDYNKLNNSYNNLISLCRSCHCQTNFKRNDWINYFRGKNK